MIAAATRNGWTGDALPRRPPEAHQVSLSRFLTFALIVILAVSGLTARLFYLQIVDGGRLATLATKNRTALEPIPSPRGLIYDRNGRALVTNVATFVVKLRPADLPIEQRPVVVDRLAALLGMTAADINATIDGNPGSTFDLVRIASDVDVNDRAAHLRVRRPTCRASRSLSRRDGSTRDGPLMSQTPRATPGRSRATSSRR